MGSSMATPNIDFIHGAGPRPERSQGAAAKSPAIRNPGVAFDRGWIDSLHVNLSAVERRIDSLGGRRTVKKAWQAAWLLKAVTCMDLTTLAGDDTPGRVERLCAKARSPFRQARRVRRHPHRAVTTSPGRSAAGATR